jgi:RIO kinase 1
MHGPLPAPPWLVTDGAALDHERGVLKSGKEADVHLLERGLPGEAGCLLAAKRYRDCDHRMFHRDATYLEGRSVRRSREMRAMERRTTHGRELIAGLWAVNEFRTLSTLWQLGVAVPYPVQLIGGELLLEFIGEPDGTAAPRLAQHRASRGEMVELWDQCHDALTALAAAGYTHGDLSPYNVLVHRGQLVLIDLPQAVDLAANPLAARFLRRDCENISQWFAARGVADADPDQLEADLRRELPGGR